MYAATNIPSSATTGDIAARRDGAEAPERLQSSALIHRAIAPETRAITHTLKPCQKLSGSVYRTIAGAIGAVPIRNGRQSNAVPTKGKYHWSSKARRMLTAS